MEFSNHNVVDLFGDESDQDEEEPEQQAEGNHSSGSSSPSSSSSSSSSSARSSRSSSSAGGGGGGGGGGVGQEEQEYDSNLVFEKIEAAEEIDDGDLFGSDNEEYQNTPAKSTFLVPVLPPIQTNNNNRPNRGGFGGGRGRGGILPRPGYPPRGGNNFGFGGRGNGARNDENFVSEMRLNKSEETLSRKPVAIQEPCEIASYSRVEGGEVYFDDRSLNLFKRSIRDHVGADLNKGFESFVEKRDLGSEGFGDLLACIRNAMVPLQNIHFVTYRNNLNKIMATAYIRNEAWKMGVHKRNGVVYLDVHKLPERPQTELDKRRCYWGYSFENLATENTSDFEEKGIDANVEFCSVIKTKLGAHRVIMGAEMDCCDSTDSGRRFYIELKTSRELDYHTEERFEREKLLKFWIQSFLAGVPYIVVGFRNDHGVLVRTERLTIKDITQRVKMKNYWQGGVCLAFTDEVLCWLYGTVKENEDYILQFVPPFHRLELLKAQSCPDAITQHVELLTSAIE